MSELSIGTLRQARAFMRTTASVVLFAYTSVVVSPSVQALQQPVASRSVSEVSHAQVHDFGKSLETAREHLRVLSGHSDRRGHSPSAADRSAAKTALRAWRAELMQLDQETRADFDTTDRLLKEKSLPTVIIQRQAAMAERYRKELTGLQTELDGALDASDQATAQDKAEAAFRHLNGLQHERAHQKFDATKLPNSALRADRNRKPRVSAHDFIVSGLIDNPLRRMASISPFDFGKLPGAADPAYRAATTEVVLSPEIVAQASALDGNPVKIFNWVHNNVEWQPTWGAIQDSSQTLSSLRGNAFDIASLTIALLRASGIPARYVHGTIDVPEAQFRNWVGGFQNIDAAADLAASGGIPETLITSGGTVKTVRIEHVWVEAAIDFVPSRGAVNRSADTWIAMDPSFKQIQVLSGLNIAQVAGIDPTQLSSSFFSSGTVDAAETSASGLNPAILTTAQTQAQTAVQSYIQQNLPNATVGDVLGGRKILTADAPVLAASLPNHVVSVGARYATLPSSLEQQMTFAFGQDIDGTALNPQTFPWAALNDKQVTLSFSPATADDETALLALLPQGQTIDPSQFPTSIPAYLINVVPELRVQGQVVMTGPSMQLGQDLNFVFNPQFVTAGVKPFSYSLPAGAYVAVAVTAGSISPKALTDAQNNLQNTQTLLQQHAAGVTGESYFGAAYASALLSYYMQYEQAGEQLGRLYSGRHVLAAGIGSFGYEPSVRYVFGVPTAIYGGAAVMNLPIVNVVGADPAAGYTKKAFTLELGTVASALEFGVPNQSLTAAGVTSSGISAIVALQKAMAQGQTLYHLTPANQASLLPLIQLDANTMADIEQALAAGEEVFTHATPISVTGWTGAGYIIFDPATGDGAYKISGGQNGGYSSYIIAFVVLMAAIAAVAVFGAMVLAAEGGMIGLIFAVINLVTYIKSLYTADGEALTVYAPWKAALGVLLAALPFFAVPVGLENDAKAFQWLLSGMNFLLQCLVLPGPFGICGS